MGRAEPGEGLDELVLAVAGDAGDAEDLARPDLEADVLTTSRPRSFVHARRPATVEHHVGRMALAAVDHQLDIATDHQLGEVVLVRLRGQPLTDHLAAPDDGDPVGDLQHLVQLVADEDDAVALSAARRRRTAKISLVSWGVSTAVGSSRTRIRASR